MEATARAAELILTRSPSDGAAPRLDIALQRRLDLRSQILRQPPPRLDDESSDANTRRRHRDALHRTVNLCADTLLRLSARTGRTFHKRRGDATHSRSPIYSRQTNDLSRRDALLICRGNPHHVDSTRKRARADADELRRNPQRGIGLDRQIGLPLPAPPRPARGTHRTGPSSSYTLKIHDPTVATIATSATPATIWRPHNFGMRPRDRPAHPALGAGHGGPAPLGIRPREHLRGCDPKNPLGTPTRPLNTRPRSTDCRFSPVARSASLRDHGRSH